LSGTRHTVAQGECIASIAKQRGMPWEKLWNHPDNASLKTLRRDPNVLLPGDEVFVPAPDTKEESRATDARHRFEVAATTAKVKIRVLVNDQPRAQTPYRLDVDGTKSTGTTDGGGFLEAVIPADAREAVLEVGKGDDVDVFTLALGTLDPIDTDSGVQGRLLALGFDAETDLEAGVRDFQTKEKLPVTGRVDDTTRARLREKFGQ
jgi:hypothetical protein